MTSRPPEIASDGLITPVVGPWAEEKYELLRNYATMFATSMKEKWDSRVYIDLFSGPGKVLIRGTSRIVLASPLIALGIPVPFDCYIFCEKNAAFLAALRERVRTGYPSQAVRFLHGDANDLVGEILAAMPPYSRRQRILGFCFGDPYRLRDLHFSTIRDLAQRYMDFLILLPTGMDAGRNSQNYLKRGNSTIEGYVGTPDWREKWSEWKKSQGSHPRFDKFLTEFYWEQMKNLGYRYGERKDSVLVRSTDKRLPLYRLGFFSRHPLGEKFWREARKYGQPQGKLFD